MPKKKQHLSAEQVTENLCRLFDGKPIRCTDVVEDWRDNATFYIETPLMKVAVVGRQILEKPSIKRWADYIIWCKETGGMYKKTRTLLGTCIPFVYRKGRMARKGDNECADLILQACGLKAEKKPQSALQRLQEIGGSLYVQVYKVLSESKVVSACFAREIMEDHHRYWIKSEEKLFCKVETETGNYRFAIDGTEHHEELKSIFQGLLKIPSQIWNQEIAA